MVAYEKFSALRLATIFGASHLDGYSWYSPVKPGRSGFDTEFMGGQWHEEVIDGVMFWYPQRAGDKLAIAQLWAAACVQENGARDKPDPSAIVMPSWRANADHALAALDVPIRIGAKEEAVVSLASGGVLRHEFPDEWYRAYPAVKNGSLASMSFAMRTPDIYHVQAIVHADEGLLKISIYRPDVVRANEFEEGTYDMCFAEMYDEGEA
jgi:hypothetical protein